MWQALKGSDCDSSNGTVLLGKREGSGRQGKARQGKARQGSIPSSTFPITF